MNIMTKHKLLIYWLLIYIIIFFLCLSLIFYFEAIRVRIALILVVLLISFIFYPIYNFDKNASEIKIEEQNRAQSNKVKSEINQGEKVKEKVEKTEQEIPNALISLNTESEENYDKIIEFCKFCGKKIDKDAKICPYCGTNF